MIRKAPLPDFHFRSGLLHEPMGKSTFNKLHSSFQRDRGFRRDEQMEVIRHNDELIELEDSAIAIVKECVEEESGGPVRTKERSPFPSNGCDEERALGKIIHLHSG